VTFWTYYRLTGSYSAVTEGLAMTRPERLALGAEDHAQQGAPQTIVGDGVEEARDAEHHNDYLSPLRERIDQFDGCRQSGP